MPRPDHPDRVPSGLRYPMIWTRRTAFHQELVDAVLTPSAELNRWREEEGLRRRGARIAFAVGGVAVVWSLVSVMFGPVADPAAQAGELPEPADLVPPSADSVSPADHPSDDGGLTVVDSGYSSYLDRSGDGVDTVVDWGAVIANTGTDLVTHVGVTVSFTGAGGRDEASDQVSLPPGGQLGLGGSFTEWDSDDFADEISGIEIGFDAEPADWWPVDDPVPRLYADEVSIGTDRYDERFPAVDFTMHSQFDEPLRSPVFSTLYRDADGDIIGGSCEVESDVDVIPPGATRQQAPYPNTDAGARTPDTVEVYVSTSDWG